MLLSYSCSLRSWIRSFTRSKAKLCFFYSSIYFWVPVLFLFVISIDFIFCLMIDCLNFANDTWLNPLIFSSVLSWLLCSCRSSSVIWSRTLSESSRSSACASKILLIYMHVFSSKSCTVINLQNSSCSCIAAFLIENGYASFIFWRWRLESSISICLTLCHVRLPYIALSISSLCFWEYFESEALQYLPVMKALIAFFL